MFFKDIPIKRKLIRVVMLTCGAVLLLTCLSFFAYEFLTFRKTTVNHLSTLGKIIGTNSAAALAFDSPDDAGQILAALEAEHDIVAAGLYNKEGKLFSHYPDSLPESSFPAAPEKNDYFFRNSNLIVFQPIMQKDRQLGSLYLKSDLGAIYDRFKLYGAITMLVMIVSFTLAYFLSRRLQRSISKPILSLAETARAVSDQQDYSVRAIKFGQDELGLLTDAFNKMLTRIQEQNEEIISFNRHLEQKVIDRTLQLESANHELEAFSYSVSHDLRAPLRAVNGYAKILEEDYNEVFDKEGKRLLKVVQENAKKMGCLIDDLLAFSRLGKKEMSKSMISMTELTEASLAEINKTVDHKAKVNINQLHTVVADYSLISQVMINLLSNAIKYSSGILSPVIEVKSYEEAGDIIYSVSDNGAGFNNDYAGKLFGVFQRLHSTEEFEGTGVGLALVKRIINKHGGRVWAYGEIDNGATFYFSLPAEPQI